MMTFQSITLRLTPVLILGAALLFVPSEDAHADNPTIERIRYTVGIIKRIGKNPRARHRITVEVDNPVELGGACAVLLSGCVQRFIPKSITLIQDRRKCDRFDFATAFLFPGEDTAVFRGRSGVIREGKARNGRQHSVQARVSCSDADSVESLEFAEPVARKLSVNGRGRGQAVTTARFIRQLTASLDPALN